MLEGAAPPAGRRFSFHSIGYKPISYTHANASDFDAKASRRLALRLRMIPEHLLLR